MRPLPDCGSIGQPVPIEQTHPDPTLTLATAPPPSAATGWIAARHLQHIVARGEAAGVKMTPVLADAGVTADMLANADAPITLAAVEILLASVSKRYSSPLLGLYLASDIQPATFGVIGYMSQACTTLAEVLEAAIRYRGLLSNIGNLSVTHRPGLVDIHWECQAGGPAFRLHATDYVLGALASLSRLLVPENARLVHSVSLARGRPASPARVREYAAFFGAPVLFDSPRSTLTVTAATAHAPLRHGDAFMKDLLERHAQDQLRRRARINPLSEDVRRLAEAMLADGLPVKRVIARQLGMSSRSLHRKLQDENTGFRAIIDEVRVQTARQHVLAGNPARAVANELGFSTHQAFLRWFRRQTGMSPAQFRYSHAATGESG